MLYRHVAAQALAISLGVAMTGCGHKDAEQELAEVACQTFPGPRTEMALYNWLAPSVTKIQQDKNYSVNFADIIRDVEAKMLEKCPDKVSGLTS